MITAPRTHEFLDVDVKPADMRYTYLKPYSTNAKNTIAIIVSALAYSHALLWTAVIF